MMRNSEQGISIAVLSTSAPELQPRQEQRFVNVALPDIQGRSEEHQKRFCATCQLSLPFPRVLVLAPLPRSLTSPRATAGTCTGSRVSKLQSHKERIQSKIRLVRVLV
jgi:hypothetical protein